VSSKTSSAIQRNPVSKTKPTKQPTKQKQKQKQNKTKQNKTKQNKTKQVFSPKTGFLCVVLVILEIVL
jgi:Na+/glutamate symporter